MPAPGRLDHQAETEVTRTYDHEMGWSERRIRHTVGVQQRSRADPVHVEILDVGQLVGGTEKSGLFEQRAETIVGDVHEAIDRPAASSRLRLDQQRHVAVGAVIATRRHEIPRSCASGLGQGQPIRGVAGQQRDAAASTLFDGRGAGGLFDGHHLHPLVAEGDGEAQSRPPQTADDDMVPEQHLHLKLGPLLHEDGGDGLETGVGHGQGSEQPRDLQRDRQ